MDFWCTNQKPDAIATLLLPATQFLNSQVFEHNSFLSISRICCMHVQLSPELSNWILIRFEASKLKKALQERPTKKQSLWYPIKEQFHMNIPKQELIFLLKMSCWNRSFLISLPCSFPSRGCKTGTHASYQHTSSADPRLGWKGWKGQLLPVPLRIS